MEIINSRFKRAGHYTCKAKETVEPEAWKQTNVIP